MDQGHGRRSSGREDIISGRRLFKSGVLLAESCEKALKACFVCEGKDYPYIHNLLGLAKIILNEKINENVNKKFLGLFKDLTPFYIKTRYPAYKAELAQIATIPFIEEKIQLVEEFITWLRPNLK